MFVEQTQTQSGGLDAIRLSNISPLTYPIVMLVLLSLLSLSVNHFVFQFPGNLYFPFGCFSAGIDLMLLYAGFLILQGRQGKITAIVKDMVNFFLVMALVILASNSAQYTPFSTIDHHILAVESYFKIDTRAFIMWTHANPSLKTVLESFYGSLSYQLCFIPVFLILARRLDLLREYYFLILTGVIIGFTFYYFFPTTAPASVISGDYFSMEQRATYLKFFQIHHYIQPSTEEGGMIALPSYHVIWAWFCVYLVREWTVAFWALLLINVVVTASCVLLGWHYCLDVVGSAVVILASHGIYHVMHSHRRLA